MLTEKVMLDWNPLEATEIFIVNPRSGMGNWGLESTGVTARRQQADV